MTTPTKPGSGPDLAVYAWLTGQDFNIGDSLLRRPYLRELAKLGDVNVWVRNASDDFLSGLGIDQAARVERSFGRWYRDALKSAVTRPTLIALNAGEIRRTRGGAGRIPAMALLAVIAKFRRGGGVWLGASIARGAAPRLYSMVYRVSARLLNIVRWRESGSLSVQRVATVGPDWAFAEGAPTREWPRKRHLAAFVLRGDRERPSNDWLKWARRAIDDMNLTPVFVVQVRGDEDLARELKAELGGRVLEWPAGASHAEQESAAREAYRESRVVIGDRLHGLIVGATEGAVPIGWVESSSWKIRAHFDAAHMGYVGEFEGAEFGSAPALTSERVDVFAQALPGQVDVARSNLARTGSLIQASLSRSIQAD